MAASEYQVGSGYSLSGGGLSGKVAVSKFSGLKMEVEVTPTSVGNDSSGKRRLEPRPGPTKPGEPVFVVPIAKGDKKLAKWWEDFNPNAKQGKYDPKDMTFSFEGDGGAHAEWQLKGVFPKSYEISDADANSADLATETITLCVTEIKREK
jgi:phage tail-like protein